MRVKRVDVETFKRSDPHSARQNIGSLLVSPLRCSGYPPRCRTSYCGQTGQQQRTARVEKTGHGSNLYDAADGNRKHCVLIAFNLS